MLRNSKLSYVFGLIVLALALGPLSDTLAGQPDYASFDAPGATYTIAIGINNSGEIVGLYGVCGTDSEDCVEHGFLRNKDQSFITIDVPGAIATNAFDISDSGEIVGAFFDSSGGEHGFLRTKKGEFETIDYPDSSTCQTLALGINSRGQIVGFYDTSDDCDGPDFAFLREANGEYVTIANPFTDDSINAYGINPLQQIVGNWLDESDSEPHERSFLRDKDGSAISFAFPGAADTLAFGINPRGIITGSYLTEHLNTLGPGHGFMRDRDGVITELRYPGAAKTLVGKINASNEFVGAYAAQLGGNLHGFVARLDGF